MKLTFRQAVKEDVPMLEQVMLVISDHEADPVRQGELVERIRANPDKYLMVAVDEETGVICGSLLGVVFEDICDTCKPILLIENVAVLPSYQGKGVGKAMFKEIEAWGKEMDCHYVILVSGNQRTGAHKFYHAIGYDEVKGFKKYLI